MAEVHAAKHAIPPMLEQGSGYMLNVASAGGLLGDPRHGLVHGDQAAAVGFSEWLAVVYGDRGIGVSVLCPAAVATAILAGKEDTLEGRGAISTEELAGIVVDGLAEEHFMISTHPWVLEKFAIKARDYDEYIRTLQADIPAAAKAAAVPV